MNFLLIAYIIFHLIMMMATLFKFDMFPWVFSGFISSLAAAVGVMCIIFVVARHIKRYDLVDAAWGWAFMAAALTSFALQPDMLAEFDAQLLVTILVCIWGVRLSWHILRRIRSTDSEDPRYLELRKKWHGNVAANVLVRVYLTQAVLATFIAIPVIHINLFPDSGWNGLALAGVLVWLVGFVVESRADAQLQSFTRHPENKGRIMDRGLWAYSRHPNYFGELTQWWGIALICLGTPFGWVGLIGPAILTYLILYVSGISLNEKRFEGRAGWASYKARTSMLIPMPPKKS